MHYSTTRQIQSFRVHVTTVVCTHYSPPYSPHSLFIPYGYFPLSGNTYGEGIGNVGSYGVFWSSSAVDSVYAYYLNFNSSNINPQRINDKGISVSVRCVFGS